MEAIKFSICYEFKRMEQWYTQEKNQLKGDMDWENQDQCPATEIEKRRLLSRLSLYNARITIMQESRKNFEQEVMNTLCLS